MNIFIYSDESGVFDKVHNDYFVFGGLIFLDKDNRDIATRKFIAAEKTLRSNRCYDKNTELKACVISNKDKSKLFRSLNQLIKFGVIVNQKNVLPQIFNSKKSKQRYLDYVYKIALKRALEKLIEEKKIIASEVERIYIFVDEHTTATDGRYELQEALEQEFKVGTFNFNYHTFYPPLFPCMIDVKLEFCNSSTKTLIRAADIIANKIYHSATENDLKIFDKTNMYLIILP